MSRQWQLRTGDALKVLPTLPAESVQTVVTDPPYGIGINGEDWDHKDIRRGESRSVRFGAAFQGFTTAWARECFRLLPPGGHLAAFGAPRMSHHLAVGIEQAGFEIRDHLIWAYGTGMAKSRRLPGGQATTLKPAYEPIVLARRPLSGTVEDNLAVHKTGALQINAAGVRRPEPVQAGLSPWWWPANLVFSHDGACGIDRCVEVCPRAIIDRQHDGEPPSRIFYCAKAPSWEREAGLGNHEKKVMSLYTRGSARPRRNFHPTVKPLSLMRWLVRLTSPPGSRVLDPFTGSGSTGAASRLEGRRFLGIEQHRPYAAIAASRIAHWERQTRRAS